MLEIWLWSLAYKEILLMPQSKLPVSTESLDAYVIVAADPDPKPHLGMKQEKKLFE